MSQCRFVTFATRLKRVMIPGWSSFHPPNQTFLKHHITSHRLIADGIAHSWHINEFMAYDNDEVILEYSLINDLRLMIMTN